MKQDSSHLTHVVLGMNDPNGMSIFILRFEPKRSVPEEKKGKWEQAYSYMQGFMAVPATLEWADYVMDCFGDPRVTVLTPEEWQTMLARVRYMDSQEGDHHHHEH